MPHVGQEIRRRREEKGWSQAKLGVLSGTGPSGISQIETGRRNPSAATLQRIAEALEVGVAELFPKAQAPLPLEDGPSLEELHIAAGCETSWLIRPEEDWAAAWGRDLTPREALGIVQEMAAEFYALKPLMAEQERDLPWARRTFSGRYKQAWQRFFNGAQEAYARGVANDVITSGETLNDLAQKLGEKPGESLDELLLAS
jgi:transcriptional regulator with XRE-family HTH domain